MEKQEKFYQELIKKFEKEKENIEIIEFNGNTKPIICKCSKCGVEQKIKNASNLLKRHSNVFCKNCFNPNSVRERQKKIYEKALSYFEKTPSLSPISIYQKERGNRRRLAVKYFCNICNQESEIYFCDLKNNFYTCRHCGKTAKQTRDDFLIWFNNKYEDFEILDILEYLSRTSRIHIRCKKCGFIFYPSVVSLKRDKKILCPKCKKGKSRAELFISNWMIKNNISFKTEVVFNWTSCRTRYDFYIPSLNLLLEYDGKQHYEFTPHFHKTIEKFEQNKNRDEEKEKMAILNGYNFLRIPYLYENRIKEILFNLFGSTTILKESKGKCLEINAFLSKEEDIV